MRRSSWKIPVKLLSIPQKATQKQPTLLPFYYLQKLRRILHFCRSLKSNSYDFYEEQNGTGGSSFNFFFVKSRKYSSPCQETEEYYLKLAPKSHRFRHGRLVCSLIDKVIVFPLFIVFSCYSWTYLSILFKFSSACQRTVFVFSYFLIVFRPSFLEQGESSSSSCQLREDQSSKAKDFVVGSMYLASNFLCRIFAFLRFGLMIYILSTLRPFAQYSLQIFLYFYLMTFMQGSSYLVRKRLSIGSQVFSLQPTQLRRICYVPETTRYLKYSLTAQVFYSDIIVYLQCSQINGAYLQNAMTTISHGGCLQAENSKAAHRMWSICCSMLRANEAFTLQTILSSFATPRFIDANHQACSKEAVFGFKAFLQDCFTLFARIDFCIYLRSCFQEAAMHLHYYLSLTFELSLASSRKLHQFCDYHIFPTLSCVDLFQPFKFKNSFFLDRKDSRSSAAIKSCFFFVLVQKGEKAHRGE